MKPLIITCAVAMLFAAAPLDVHAAAVTLVVDDGTTADWESHPSVTVGDKQFTYISQTGLDANVNAEFQEVVPYLYNVTLHDLEDGPVDDFLLEFAVEIIGPFNIDLDFAGANLDTTSILSDTSVTAEIYADAGFSTLLASMTTVNGIPTSNVSFGGDQIWVRLIGDIENGGILSDVTLQIQQIPEPGAMALAAIGVAGMVGGTWIRRRRRSRS